MAASTLTRRCAHRFALLLCLSAPLLQAQNKSEEWIPLFDGKSLAGWKETPFKGQGQVSIDKGTIILNPGGPMTGVTWAGQFPQTNYEIRFEAVRTKGNDFFASLTFPVQDSF